MTKQRHSFTTKAIYHHTKAFRQQGLCERMAFSRPKASVRVRSSGFCPDKRRSRTRHLRKYRKIRQKYLVEPVKRAEPLFPKNPTDYSPRPPLRKQKNRHAHRESDEPAVCGRCRPDSVARLPDKRPSAFGVRQHFIPRTSAAALRNGPIVRGPLATSA